MPLDLDILDLMKSSPVGVMISVEFSVVFVSQSKRYVQRNNLLSLLHSSVFTNRALRGYTPTSVLSTRCTRRPVPLYPLSLKVLSASKDRSSMISSLCLRSWKGKMGHQGGLFISLNSYIPQCRHDQNIHEEWTCLHTLINERTI